MGELVVFEKQLEPLAPHFEQALAGIMPVSRLIRTAMVAVERNDDLLDQQICSRQSLFNTIMSSAVLGLEMDGVTGQCFPIPFKGKAQLVIGYKGYNTLGARAGISITGEVVREGDHFDYRLGSDAYIDHRPALGNKGRIIAAWSLAAANGRPPIPVVMGIDDILAIKAKSPGAKRAQSPWNDPEIGYPAMCSKTAKRRLARSTPLTVQTAPLMLAARMDEAHEEQGAHAYIQADRTLAIISPIPESEPVPTPTAERLTTPIPRAAIITDDDLDILKLALTSAARGGMDSFRRHWETRMSPAERRAAEPWKDDLKKIAAAIDAGPR